jgi:sugar phosphate permease
MEMQGSLMRGSLSVWQIRIVVVGWVTYASYYFGRVNLSAAIPEIKTNLLLTSQQLGLLGTGFFLTTSSIQKPNIYPAGRSMQGLTQ